MTQNEIERRENEVMARPIALNGGDMFGCAKFITASEQKELDELELRRMTISCYAYHTEYNIYSEKDKEWGRIGLNYASKLGKRNTLKIFREQLGFMRKNYSIEHGTYTESDGQSYNSLAEK